MGERRPSIPRLKDANLVRCSPEPCYQDPSLPLTYLGNFKASVRLYLESFSPPYIKRKLKELKCFAKGILLTRRIYPQHTGF
ncbi:unnamed protein product [Caretta caretta]